MSDDQVLRKHARSLPRNTLPVGTLSLTGPAFGRFAQIIIKGRYQPSYSRTSQPSIGRRKRCANQASGETSKLSSESPKLKAAPNGPTAWRAKSPVCEKPGRSARPKL